MTKGNLKIWKFGNLASPSKHDPRVAAAKWVSKFILKEQQHFLLQKIKLNSKETEKKRFFNYIFKHEQLITKKIILLKQFQTENF
jgi:hypothetical protein